MKNYKPPYSQWNYTTACCYKHKMNCDQCPNDIVCSTITNKINGLHPYKYAALKTYANIGLQGFKRAFAQKVMVEGDSDDTRNE